MKTIYTNAQIWLDGAFRAADLAVQGERIAQIAPRIEPRPDDRMCDLRGLHLLPGLVDVHVHLREPGFPGKETIATGTAAAARGGYTTVCAMPNVDPAPDTPEHLAVQLELIRRDARVEVLPYGCITRGRRGRGEPVDFAALAPHVAGFSDDGCGVQDEALMEQAMRGIAATGLPLAAHCEDEALLRGGYIHDGAYCRAHGHRGICSESEWRQVERDLRLVARTGCRYHVCHVSTAESVRLIRTAQRAGLPVSCETAPHYLLLSDAELREEGRFKMNPPLRSPADRDALLEGVADGTIAVIATDHAPHTDTEKARGLSGSAMGVVGLECAFPVLYTHLVLRGILPMQRLVELMAEAPRRVFSIGGGLRTGERADLTAFDLDAEYAIDPAGFRSKGRSTPFAEWRVRGRCMLTLVAGQTAYDGREAE